MKKTTFLAVILAIIANLLLVNSVLAKKLELTDKEIGNIKNGLDLVKLFVNLSIDDTKLKSVLNIVINGGKTGTDVTYGLLVLTSLNEIEFIDMVVSQRYKTEATKYFESVLDERTNLVSYYKGIGYDLPRILSGKITGPMAALTLNAFDITDKTIQVLVEINLLKEIKTYDGLRRYFELRRDDNESHEIAWEEIEIIMGRAKKIDRKSLLKQKEIEKVDNFDQLEQQFSALYDKWGPYTDEKGVKKEFRDQVKNELGNTIALAVDDYNKLAEKEAKISFWGTVKNKLVELAEKVSGAGIALRQEFIKLNDKVRQMALFGGAQVSQAPQEALEETEERKVAENLTELTEAKPQSLLAEEMITPEDSIIEEIKELEKKAEESQAVDEVNVREAEPPSEISPQSQVGLVAEIKKEEIIPQWCQKQAGGQPLRNSVIFSEIAWMGSKNSANDEWMKLRNVSGSEIDLTGWQILDKDQQVKLNFNDGYRISIKSINGAFLLERTNDDSLPGTAADLIYTGALNDNDETLYLFDNNCQLQDEVLASPDWPAGDKNNHWPLERNADLSWRNQGGQAVIFNYGTPASPPPTASAQPAATTILISEIQIAPSGDRFVELYNPNNEAVNLTGWYIQRKTQTGNSWNSFITSTDFEGKNIGALGYFLVASSSQADIFLNLTLTEGNSLRLKNPDQEIIGEVSWENPASGKSWGRQWATSTQSYNDFELQTPTPKAQNQSLSQSSNQAPSAFFVYTPSNPFTVGQEIVFDAASSSDSDGTISAFLWDFGDGSSATTNQATTTHSFASAVDFLISLTVIDDNNATSSPATSTVSVANSETSPLLVVINEIAWAGTKAGSSDEWIELFNNSSSTVDIAGWRLVSADGSPDVTFSTSTGTTTISAEGYFLLERTNSSTTNVAEDYIFIGALDNDGEKLELRDANNNLVDSVDFSSGWPTGSSAPNYLSMERVSATTSGTSSANWVSNNLAVRNGKDATGKQIGGTPRAKNSVSYSSTVISGSLFDEFPEITLTRFGSPYVTETKSVPKNGTLTLKEGVILKLKKQAGVNYTAYWNIYGKFVAEGTEQNPVVITYFGDDEYGGDTNNDGTSTLPIAGSWRYLRFASTTATSTLDGTIIRYGGGDCDTGFCWGAIRQERGVGVEIKNSRIEKNIWGIFSDESSSDCGAVFQKIKLENTVFSENDRNIYLGSGNECVPP